MDFLNRKYRPTVEIDLRELCENITKDLEANFPDGGKGADKLARMYCAIITSDRETGRNSIIYKALVMYAVDKFSKSIKR